MKKKSYQSRLDILGAALNNQGLAGPYCSCRSSQAKEIMQTLSGCKEELKFPACTAEVCNPRPMGNITKEPEPGSHDRTIEIMFPDGIQERPGQIAAEAWRDVKEPIGVIDLVDPEPEPEPEPADPIAAMILKRLLNKKELADVLLVPESTQDD